MNVRSSFAHNLQLKHTDAPTHSPTTNPTHGEVVRTTLRLTGITKAQFENTVAAVLRQKIADKLVIPLRFVTIKYVETNRRRGVVLEEIKAVQNAIALEEDRALAELNLTGKVDLLSSCKLDSAGLQRLCEVYDNLPCLVNELRTRTFEAPLGSFLYLFVGIFDTKFPTNK